MIRVSVHLISALGSDRNRELARMDIVNDGTGDDNAMNYMATSYIGRDTAALDRRTPAKRAHVGNWPRHDVHIWNLVRWCLYAMGYRNEGRKASEADYRPIEPVHVANLYYYKSAVTGEIDTMTISPIKDRQAWAVEPAYAFREQSQ